MNNVFQEIEPTDKAPRSTKQEVVGTLEMLFLFSNITELFTVTLMKAFSTMLTEEDNYKDFIAQQEDDGDDIWFRRENS